MSFEKDWIGFSKCLKLSNFELVWYENQKMFATFLSLFFFIVIAFVPLLASILVLIQLFFFSLLPRLPLDRWIDYFKHSNNRKNQTKQNKKRLPNPKLKGFKLSDATLHNPNDQIKIIYLFSTR